MSHSGAEKVYSSGQKLGQVWEDGPESTVPFNRPSPKLTRLLAAPPQLVGEIEAYFPL